MMIYSAYMIQVTDNDMFSGMVLQHLGAYLGKEPYWQLITLCWLYFGVMFQI